MRGAPSALFIPNLCDTIRPLAPKDELTSSYRVEDILDKGRAAAVLVGVETRNLSCQGNLAKLHSA